MAFVLLAIVFSVIRYYWEKHYNEINLIRRTTCNNYFEKWLNDSDVIYFHNKNDRADFYYFDKWLSSGRINVRLWIIKNIRKAKVPHLWFGVLKVIP